MNRAALRLTLCALLIAAPRSASSQNAPVPPPVASFNPQSGQGPASAPVEAPDRGVGDLARSLTPAPIPPLDQAELAGLPAGSPLELLTWERAYQLAWIRAHAEPPDQFEVLDPTRLAERARALGWGDFARFRAEALASRAWRDPAADLLDLQARFRGIEAARGGLAAAELWTKLLTNLIEGESAGLNKDDLDRAVAAAAAGRREVERLTAEYRDRLDEFKVGLGLAPRVAVGLDPAPLAAFAAAFAATDRWATSLRRELVDLGATVGSLPTPGDLAIAGRGLIGEVADTRGRLAEALDLAARAALDHRRDRDEPADVVELRVRRRVRHLVDLRAEYAFQLRSLVLAARQRDVAFDRIIAPPVGTTSGAAGQAVADLLGLARQIAEGRGRLVATWAAFQAELLATERDLGLAIADDWPSFVARFEARPARPDAAAAAAPSRQAPTPADVPRPQIPPSPGR